MRKCLCGMTLGGNHKIVFSKSTYGLHGNLGLRDDCIVLCEISRNTVALTEMELWRLKRMTAQSYYVSKTHLHLRGYTVSNASDDLRNTNLMRAQSPLRILV